MRTDEILIGLAGDLLIDRPHPPEIFCEVRDLLHEPDILFGNLEAPYSDSPQRAITANTVVAPRALNLEGFVDSGFHVLSMANNHIVDAGHAAMLETRSRLKSMGIETCGAGENLAEARRPAIVERKGIKVGFLAYASVFPHGYEARNETPGLAPLRAYNHFYEFPQFHGPGNMPRIETLPDPEDHRQLEVDLLNLRSQVDVLAVSFHWGDFSRPYVITDHERRTARLCIDHGADLIVGHHHHALRGIEWYRGKPIFYGLGHFVFDLRLQWSEKELRTATELDPDAYTVAPREGWPLLPLHPDTRMTGLAWAKVSRDRVLDVGLVPCRLRPDGRVAVVHPDSEEGREVIGYLRKCNTRERLNGQVVCMETMPIGPHRSMRIVPLS